MPGHIPMTCPRLDCFSFMSNHAADKDLLREYQLISKHMCATECDKSLKKLESKLQRTLRLLPEFTLLVVSFIIIVFTIEIFMFMQR